MFSFCLNPEVASTKNDSELLEGYVKNHSDCKGLALNGSEVFQVTAKRHCVTDNERKQISKSDLRDTRRANCKYYNKNSDRNDTTVSAAMYAALGPPSKSAHTWRRSSVKRRYYISEKQSRRVRYASIR